MSDLSRRDVLRRLAVSFAAAGFLDADAAREVHLLAAQTTSAGSGSYSPRALDDHEYRTLELLTDLIIPVENGAPGALAAGAAAWIDTISSENQRLTRIYKDGITWLDRAIRSRGAETFLAAAPEQQTALLDIIAFRRNETPELAPGIQFFSWVRRMTVDAFYTSEIGIRDIDYRGNSAMAAYPPPTEAIAYALKKSGLP